MNAPRFRIVGCGSPDAGDDAAGLLIADSLRGQLPPEIDIRTDNAGGVNVFDWCEGVEVLILVDVALATPSFLLGQWRRISFPAERERFKLLAFRSTHALGVGEALQLAHRLGRLPGEVMIFAVAGEQFELGAGLSPALQTSLPDLLAAVRVEVINRPKISSLRP